MSRKTILSILLIILGVCIGMLVLFTYSMSGGKVSITLLLLAIAFAFIIAGSILGFSRLLDRQVSPILEEIHKDLEDDIQELKEHRIPKVVWMILIIVIAALTFFFFVFRLHKVEAMWGPIPVVLVTFVGMGALAWFILRTRWFQNPSDYTPMRVFFIPTVGLILSLVLGLNKTENVSTILASRQESVEYNSYQPTGLFFQVADVGARGLFLAIPDCQGDSCGAMMLVIALIFLTFILVLGSAVIPHFWLFSSTIFLAIMAIIVVHDLRIRPPEIPERIKNPPWLISR